jgi:hypothetical protein
MLNEDYVMAKAKKTTAKKQDEGLVEARPQGEGYDPLSRGDTLKNPTNTEAETHYEVKERSEDVAAAEEKAKHEIAGQDANERAVEHNAESPTVPNETSDEQEAVASKRSE